MHRLGVEALGERGGPFQVTEEQRDSAAHLRCTGSAGGAATRGAPQ